MLRQTVTILDVARRAGVSKTTASDALTGAGRVSAATRAKVEAAAEALGYAPSTAARHLRRSRTGAVGLHLPQMATSVNYYMHCAFGAAERARESGYDLTLFAADHAAEGPLSPRVDGVVVIDPLLDYPVVDRLLAGGVPVVTGERYLAPGAPATGVVRADHAGAIAELLDHLREQGARRPALLVPEATSDWADSLRRGFDDWCAKAGVPAESVTVAFDAAPSAVTEATRELLERSPHVDAVICAPDEATIGVPGAAAAVGRTVGRDLLLASCVDSPTMQLSVPPITSIDIDPRGFGRACIDLLFEIIEGRAAPATHRIRPFELNIRASTAPLVR